MSHIINYRFYKQKITAMQAKYWQWMEESKNYKGASLFLNHLCLKFHLIHLKFNLKDDFICKKW